MFESGSYKSLPEHVALYEALEASIEQAHRDEFLTKRDKSRNRRRDDQDPPPPPPDLDLKDTDSAHLLKIKQRLEWLKPIPDDERPATPKPAWVIPSSHVPDVENNWANALATMYQAPAKNSLLKKIRDMRTFMHYKGSRQALSISKIKVAHYLDFGLKLLVPEHMWINKVVRTHMRILNVVSIKAFSRYGYDYLKEITLCRADYKEYTIIEKDFKSLYPGNFKDLNLLLLQGHPNHLSGLDKRFEYKHDYTIIYSPRAVVFPVGNNERKIMRFNEIYKFSDGMLTNIMEALDFRVKEYKVNRLNP
nr:hypothetical protein [Tanacetum cinerariifolium]